MDRTITVGAKMVEMAARGEFSGVRLVFPVQVDWPELQLTESQMLTNVAALANGQEPPFPDRSVFMVVVDRAACGPMVPAVEELHTSVPAVLGSGLR